MRVLLIVTRAELGGAQRVVAELAERLLFEGCSVTVASGENGWLLDEARRMGCATRVFANLSRDANVFKAPLFVAELYRFLKAHPHEVVHLNSSNALAGSWGARLAGARTVFTVHGLSILDAGYEANPLLRALYWLWFKLWLLSVDEVVAVATANAERLAALRLARAITVIPNGLDAGKLAFLPGEDARRELGLSEGPVVMSIGRLEYAKRYELLLDAWRDTARDATTATLILIGDGPERAALQARCEALGISRSVVFAGAREAAYRFLTAADVMVLPSRYEGWPIVLLEALAAGVPVVATDVGGIGELVGDAGVLIPRAAKAGAWARAITDLLGSHARRAELAQHAAERGLRWDSASMARRYLDLYRS